MAAVNHVYVMLQELKEYRRAGIRTFSDAELYEADKKRKSTVQPNLAGAPPGSLPRNWHYSGSSAAEVILYVCACICCICSIASTALHQSCHNRLAAMHWLVCSCQVLDIGFCAGAYCPWNGGRAVADTALHLCHSSATIAGTVSG